MNFDFSDEQKELKDQVRKFLTDKCDFTVPRSVLESDEPFARELWQSVCEMGWTGAAIPEKYGGIGMGYLELCVMAEELGRAVAPIPFSSSIYLAAEAVLTAGSEEQKAEYLPKLATGEAIGTLAVSEGPQPATPDKLETTFEQGRLNGTKTPVPDGDVADIAIVAAKDLDANGLTLVFVDLNADGVVREPISTVDPTRSHATIRFENTPGVALGTPGTDWMLLETVLDRAAVLFAFEQLGGAIRCLEMARDYSLERYAFGRPIGSFQAVKHRLADVYVKNQLATSNCYYGAWALSTNADELPIAAAGARVSATDAYHYAAKESIQVHGGIGFTWEYDAHFFYRRSKLLGLALGSPRRWKDRLINKLEAHQPAATA